MKLMQRLGSFENVRNDEYIDDYIDIIKSNPGSCDEVWLGTPYGFPTLEEHKKYAEFLKKAADKFRTNGINVSMQISNIIGHGHRHYIYGFDGVNYEGSPVEKMVGADGTVAEYCFCFRGEHYRKYILEQLTIYAEIRPDRFWFDDDFSMQNHSPVDFGCFCDDCIAKFNAENNTSFTRDELYNEILFGDLKWREEWMNFVREGFREIVLMVGEMFKRISPETKMGHQHGPYGAYYAYDFNHIFDAMKEVTGEAPWSRPGGGAYNDHNPNLMIGKALDISVQNATLPDYVKHNAPEVESIPFTAFGKTPGGTAFESSLYFAYGATDMSYSMLMDNPEDKNFYKRAFRLFANQRSYWERLSEINMNTYQGGIRYYTSDKARFKKLLPDENINDLKQNNHRELMAWVRDGIPVSFDKNEDSIIVLHPENVRGLQDEDIEYLLNKNVITDGESIKMLKERGFDLGVNITEVVGDYSLELKQNFLDHKTKPTFRNWYQSSFFTAGRPTICYAECDNAEVLSTYTDLSGKTVGIADLIVVTPKGKKWAILCNCPWKGIVPTYIRNRIFDIADYISDNALPARIDDSVQAILLPRKNSDGKTVSVSVVNCTIGKNEETKLIIRNPVGEKFTFESQYGGRCELDYEKIGEDYIVDLPMIDAWSVATVFID